MNYMTYNCKVSKARNYLHVLQVWSSGVCHEIEAIILPNLKINSDSYMHIVRISLVALIGKKINF